MDTMISFVAIAPKNADFGAKMDENNDGQLTQDEFLKGCLQDEELSKMLAP